jgi:hypothetical protein
MECAINKDRRAAEEMSMGKDEMKPGLSPRKVALLLKIGSGDQNEAEQLPPEKARAELLRELLAKRLPADDLAVHQLVAHLGDLCNSLNSALGEPIDRQLLDRTTGVDTLRRIKEHGAMLSRTAQRDVEQETANVIYYGAIASALVFHGRQITEFRLGDLQAAFATLSCLTWIPPELARLFEQALEFCRRSRSAQAEKPGDE